MKRLHDPEFQVPLLQAFREAFGDKDARRSDDVRLDGERVVSKRSAIARRGMEEARLRESLGFDLVSLTNTTDLAASIDLGGWDRVKASILNFGLCDMVHRGSEDAAVETIGDDLKTALLRHEPRLRPGSIVVERDGAFDPMEQKIRFAVRAEMICRPLDVSLAFVAELDMGAGKLSILKRPGLG